MRGPMSLRGNSRSVAVQAYAQQRRRKMFNKIPLSHPYIIPSYLIAFAGIVMVVIGAFFKIHALFAGILCFPLTCAYCSIIKRCKGDELVRYNMERYNQRQENRVDDGEQESNGISVVSPPGTANIAFVGDPNVVTGTGEQIVMGEFPNPPPYAKDVPKYCEIMEVPNMESVESGDRVNSHTTSHVDDVNNRTTWTTGIAPW